MEGPRQRRLRAIAARAIRRAWRCSKVDRQRNPNRARRAHRNVPSGHQRRRAALGEVRRIDEFARCRCVREGRRLRRHGRRRVPAVARVARDNCRITLNAPTSFALVTLRERGAAPPFVRARPLWRAERPFRAPMHHRGALAGPTTVPSGPPPGRTASSGGGNEPIPSLQSIEGWRSLKVDGDAARWAAHSLFELHPTRTQIPTGMSRWSAVQVRPFWQEKAPWRHRLPMPDAVSVVPHQ